MLILRVILFIIYYIHALYKTDHLAARITQQLGFYPTSVRSELKHVTTYNTLKAEQHDINSQITRYH